MATLIVLYSLAVIFSGVSSIACALWRFGRLRASAVAFADCRSSELWRDLAQRQPLLVVTEALNCGARDRPWSGRETLKADASRVFVHFGYDARATVPVIWLHEAGPVFLMEVAYSDKLAAVILAVIAGLRPVCAICIGHPRPAHPSALWPRLICKLDGPPWFVLCCVMRSQARVQRLSSSGAEVLPGEHART